MQPSVIINTSWPKEQRKKNPKFDHLVNTYKRKSDKFN